MTEEGWKPISKIQEGDRVSIVSLFDVEKRWERIVRIVKKNENVHVYNLSLGEKAMIANGFICGDFEMQNRM